MTYVRLVGGSLVSRGRVGRLGVGTIGGGNSDQSGDDDELLNYTTAK